MVRKELLVTALLKRVEHPLTGKRTQQVNNGKRKAVNRNVQTTVQPDCYHDCLNAFSTIIFPTSFK